MIREWITPQIAGSGTAVHLRTPDGKILVVVSGSDRAEVEHHARRIEAGDAVIQAVIPLLRAMRNGLSKRVYMLLEDEDPSIQKAVVDAINASDDDLLLMIPTRVITSAP